jgi:hypothetical protein
MAERKQGFNSLHWLKTDHEDECNEMWSNIFFGRQFHSQQADEENSRFFDECFRNEDIARIVLLSAPMSALLSKKVCTVVSSLAVLVISIILVLETTSNFRELFFSGNFFRFIPIELANGAMGTLTKSNIDKILLYENGCPVQSVGTSTERDGYLIVRLDEVIRPNLIAIISNVPDSLKPVRYSLQASDDGLSWTEISAPPWLPARLDFRSTPQRNWFENRSTVDFSPPTAWVLDRAIYFFLYLGFFIVFACCQASRTRLALQVLALSFLAMCPLSIAIAAGDHPDSCAYLAVQHAGFAVSSMLVGAALWSDTLSLEAIAGLNAAHLALKLGTQNTAQSGTLPGLAWAAIALSNGLPLVVAAGLLCLREAAWRRVCAAVAVDRRHMDSAFSYFVGLSESPDLEHGDSDRLGEPGEGCAVAALASVCATCAALTAGRALLRPRQQEPVGGGGGGGAGRPVRSLDRLYLQAALIRGPFLRRVSAAVAAAAPGCTALPATLKPLERAAAKAARAYGGDVSWLGDVCRHGVVCETPAAMLRCLRALAGDPQLAVVAVRCALEPARATDSDAAAAGRGGRGGCGGCGGGDNGGYRFVRVNVTLRTEEASLRGVRGHVCEVLLLPAAVAQRGSADQHARYLRLRDGRGGLTKAGAARLLQGLLRARDAAAATWTGLWARFSGPFHGQAAASFVCESNSGRGNGMTSVLDREDDERDDSEGPLRALAVMAGGCGVEEDSDIGPYFAQVSVSLCGQMFISSVSRCIEIFYLMVGRLETSLHSCSWIL